MSANGEAQPTNVAIVALQGVNILVGHAVDNPKQKVLGIGPVMLQLPLDENAAKAIVKGLTGVQVAKPGDVL